MDWLLDFDKKMRFDCRKGKGDAFEPFLFLDRDERYFIICFVVTVLPAPDSPETRIHWSQFIFGDVFDMVTLFSHLLICFICECKYMRRQQVFRIGVFCQMPLFHVHVKSCIVI